MSVRYHGETDSWVYDCIWGCYEGEFPSAAEAESAHRWHECRSRGK